MNDTRFKILNDINVERKRQDHLHPQKLTLQMRFVTIMEEAGEVAEALQDNDMDNVYCELIDTAACCVRMAEEVLKKHISNHVNYNDLTKEEKEEFHKKLETWFD